MASVDICLPWVKKKKGVIIHLDLTKWIHNIYGIKFDNLLLYLVRNIIVKVKI